MGGEGSGRLPNPETIAQRMAGIPARSVQEFMPAGVGVQQAAKLSSIGQGNAFSTDYLYLNNNSVAAAKASNLVTSDYVVVAKDLEAPGFAFVVASPAAGNRGVFKAVKCSGNLTAPAVPIGTDQNVFSLLGAIYDGTDTEATAGITFYVDGAVSNNVAPQRISFLTSETNGAARTERMTIKADGKVGIGNTAPSYLLHLTGDTGFSVDGTGRTDGVTINHTGVGNYQLNHEGTGQLTIKSTGGGVILQAGTSSDNLTFNTGDTTGARITIIGGAGADLGNVGIGTTTPDQRLDVSGNIQIGAWTTPTAVSGNTILFTSGNSLWSLNGFNVFKLLN